MHKPNFAFGLAVAMSNIMASGKRRALRALTPEQQAAREKADEIARHNAAVDARKAARAARRAAK